MDIDFGRVLYIGLQEVIPGFVPILVACIVALWPGQRPNRKLLFIVVSVSLSWGLPVFFAILLSPMEWYLVHIEPALRDQNLKSIPDFLVDFTEHVPQIGIIMVAILSVLVPIYLRVRIWPSIFPNRMNREILSQD